MTTAVDFDAPYAVPADLRIVPRGDRTVQIGTESPRRMMVVDAPADAADVLERLNGTMSVGEAVARSHGDRAVWQPLLAAMLTTGLLVPAPRDRSQLPAHLAGEQLSMIHRYGTATADRLLGARSDAIVVVEGDGPAADGIAALLAGCGVGHVYHGAVRHGSVRHGSVRPGVQARARAPGTAGDVPHPSAWDASPDVRVHRPAPQVPPSVVVMAGRASPDLARAAELVTSLIPHLAVRVTQARVIIGPMVLPGRTSCLNCAERHRTDLDAGWPAVAAVLREHPIAPGALAAQMAADLATEQVLQLLDGRRSPDTVDATIERVIGRPQVRRRTWPPHADCGCQLLSGHL